MQELSVTWERVAAIWRLILWRWVAGCVVLSLTIGLTAIFIQVQTGTWDPLTSPGQIATLVAVLVNVLWSLVVVRLAMRKWYRHFRLVLVAVEPRPDLWDVVGEVTKQTEKRGL
jgi:hypothetical protein